MRRHKSYAIMSTDKGTRNVDICFPRSITKTPIAGTIGVFSVF